LITVRNPQFQKQEVKIKLHHPENLLRVIYPYHEWFLSGAVNSDGLFRYELHDNEVVTFESVPPAELKRPVVLGVRSRIGRQTATETEYEITSPADSFTFTIKSTTEIKDVMLDGEKLTQDKNGNYRVELSSSSLIKMYFKANAVPADDTVALETFSDVSESVQNPGLVMIVQSDIGSVPMQVKYDAATATASAHGRGWSAFEFPVKYGSHKNTIAFDADSIYSVPFLNSSNIKLYVAYTGVLNGVNTKLLIRHEPASPDDSVLPPAPSQDMFRFVDPVVKGQGVSINKLRRHRSLGADDFKEIKAAKIHIRLLGSRPDDLPRNILLNGAPVATLPTNEFPYDNWENFTIDIPQANLHAVRQKNKIVVRNLGGSQFKFTAVALAVQLADGNWVSTNFSDEVHYTGRDWIGAEGTYFETSSRPVYLNF
ncbi:MAG: hypothetical protein AB1546_07240, partial [bacterium]